MTSSLLKQSVSYSDLNPSVNGGVLGSTGDLAQGQKVPPMPGTQFGLPQQFLQYQQQQQQQFESSRTSAIFWDFENCPPPSGMPGYVVVENIRNVVHHFGIVTQFKAYLEISEDSNTKKNLRSELQSSGVSLTDCPHNGRKDAVDKMLMVDMLAFAIDNPPPATIVLISGDKDFVYALGVLRNRKYNIVLIVPGRGAPIILRSQANTILEWRYDVLNQDVWNQQQQQVMLQQQSQYADSSCSPSTNSSSSVQSASSGNQTVQTSTLSSASTNGSSNVPLLLNSRSSSSSSPESSSSLSPPFEQHHSDHLTQSSQLGNPRKNLRLNIIQQQQQQGIGINDTHADQHPQDISIFNESNIEYEGFCFSPKAPGYFDLLVETLERFRAGGEPQPRRSKVGSELSRRNPLLYHRAACSSFREYVEMAAKEGIVEIGGDKGLAWISLKENHRGKLF